MSEIPKRPVGDGDAAWIAALAAHEHAVAKVAVEALRKIQTDPASNPTAIVHADAALSKIEASGWKP